MATWPATETLIPIPKPVAELSTRPNFGIRVYQSHKLLTAAAYRYFKIPKSVDHETGAVAMAHGNRRQIGQCFSVDSRISRWRFGEGRAFESATGLWERIRAERMPIETPKRRKTQA